MTSLSNLGGRQVLVQPTLVVSPLVGPLRFKLVLPGPEEVTLNVGVEDVEGTVSKGLDLLLGEASGITGALSGADS